MKKLVLILLLAILLGCKKDEIIALPDDESIEMFVCPGIAIYKTKRDYFNYMAMRFNSDNSCSWYPWFGTPDPRLSVENGAVAYKYRFHLKNSYVVSAEITFNDYFTNITYPEYLTFQKKTNETFTSKMFWDRVIDKDPFTEFYYLDTLDCRVKFTLGELNQMIEDGTLTQKFTKFK
jgi:hypothetical protein